MHVLKKRKYLIYFSCFLVSSLSSGIIYMETVTHSTLGEKDRSSELAKKGLSFVSDMVRSAGLRVCVCGI